MHLYAFPLYSLTYIYFLVLQWLHEMLRPRIRIRNKEEIRRVGRSESPVIEKRSGKSFPMPLGRSKLDAHVARTRVRPLRLLPPLATPLFTSNSIWYRHLATNRDRTARAYPIESATLRRESPMRRNATTASGAVCRCIP